METDLVKIQWWDDTDGPRGIGSCRFSEGISAPNLSACFLSLTLNLLDFYMPKGDCLLVGENPEVIPVLQPLFPDLNFFTFGYSGDLGQIPNQDFNILFEPSRAYDVVLCQSCLEHVCRPSIFLENMNNLCKIGGYSISTTHGPLCPLHGVPIDCSRFLRDFFISLCDYVPMRLVAYYADSQANPMESLYVAPVYQRLS